MPTRPLLAILYAALRSAAFAAALWLTPPLGAAPPPEPAVPESARETAPADVLLETLEPAGLRDFAREVLERSPDVARAHYAAEAMAARAPQVRSLPDPMASLTLFLLPPETRVGPQRATVSLSQRLPWFGKLRLAEQSVLLDAAAARARVEALRLERLTEARRLYWELAFVAEQRAVLKSDELTLARYEELARARYAAGAGQGQAAVKLQAEITRLQARMLELDAREAALRAQANALRDRPADAPLDIAAPPPPESLAAAPELWEEAALARRPELAAFRLEAEAARTRTERAELERRPNFNVGLAYTAVERRDDEAGRRNPPEGNGDDVLGVTGSVEIPFWKKRIDAGVLEAAARESEVDAARRALTAGIAATLGDLAQQIPLIEDRLALFGDVLTVQAEESLRSAETGYVAGTHRALDLVDAERVLLDVRVAVARARADHAVAVARLEGALGAPLSAVPTLSATADAPSDPERPER